MPPGSKPRSSHVKLRVACRAIGALMALATALPAAALTIGVSVSATGPGAALGVPYRNAALLLPDTLGGQHVDYVILDDASDASVAARNAQKLVSEDKADVVIGSALTPTSLAMVDILSAAKTAQLVLAPIDVPAAKRVWVFVVPQPVPLMVDGIVQQMKRSGVRSVGYIGFRDPLGDVIENALAAATAREGVALVSRERYARTDTSVLPQVLRLMAARPDAAFIGAAGTPGALPHVQLVEQGFKGTIYHNHGDVVGDFIRVGGKAVEGAIAETGPMMVSEQLPDSNPVKAVSEKYNRLYEARYGADSRNPFSGYMFDAFLLLEHAVPRALAHARPGGADFRVALRDALESGDEVVGNHGVYVMTPMDHNGLDARARVLVKVHDGRWELVR